MTAKQTFLRERECKGSVRYVPVVGLQVDGKPTPSGVDMTSVVYVNRPVLEALGNPAKMTITVEADK